jgi:hypothetical protein
VGRAWSDHRERNVLKVIAVLDEAGQNVTSDSIHEFIVQKTIDLGPLPAGASIPNASGWDATKVQVLLSLDALQREDPPYITAAPTRSLLTPFPDSVLNIRLAARGRDAVARLLEPRASTQRSPIGFQPPQRED